MTASLAGRRVLVVEDEALVAMLLQDNLSELGCDVIASVARLADALAAVRDATELDVAVLDVNLAGESSEPVAAELAARDIPFLVATGYGELRGWEHFRDAPMLHKPFGMEDLRQALGKALDPTA